MVGLDHILCIRWIFTTKPCFSALGSPWVPLGPLGSPWVPGPPLKAPCCSHWGASKQSLWTVFWISASDRWKALERMVKLLYVGSSLGDQLDRHIMTYPWSVQRKKKGPGGPCFRVDMLRPRSFGHSTHSTYLFSDVRAMSIDFKWL